MVSVAAAQWHAMMAAAATRSKNQRGSGIQAKGPTVDSVYPDGSYAVIIGINDYESAGVDPEDGGMRNLSCARQDGELLSPRSSPILGGGHAPRSMTTGREVS